ncbi:MAG: HD domain-containing protein [Desulfatibacillum sp.]|nr:HD domain-containing protein [Desulfatibacillum sp.]
MESSGLNMTDETECELDRLINHVQEIARAFFTQARTSHDWDHTQRVLALARHIALAEGADMEVVTVAAYLHDIGRARQDSSNGSVCHAQKGAEMATPLLQKLGIPEGKRENILHCIRSHRFRKGEAPQTLEARVLFDADKLDSIGAIGVARAFAFAGEVGARLHSPDKDPLQTQAYSEDDTGFREFEVKLKKVKDRMQTGEGKRFAKKRHAFMKAFFTRFLAEYDGHK